MTLPHPHPKVCDLHIDSLLSLLTLMVLVWEVMVVGEERWVDVGGISGIDVLLSNHYLLKSVIIDTYKIL